MLCPLLWKQDTRTLQCYFMRMLTSPKPSHRYGIITVISMMSLLSLSCLLTLTDMPLFLRGLLDSAERCLQVQPAGACLTRSPPASHDKPLCCYWFTLNNALPIVGCWTGNLPDTYEHSRLQPKVPSERNHLGMSCWNESADRRGHRFIHWRPFLCLKFFLFLRKSPFFNF